MSTQCTASWCLFLAPCRYCARRGTFKSILSGSLCPFSLGSIGKKNTVCLLLEFWPTRIKPLLIIVWRLKSTSNVVNMLEESALNYHIVLQRRINKVASWMSLKSSEINDCSWNISAELISHFCSSSCRQACFPTIVRPIRNLWILTLKIINSEELNCSVFFSLYYLRVSKKMDYLIRDLVRRERRIS